MDDDFILDADDDAPLWSYRRRLPHWRVWGATYFVTWRVRAGCADLDADERSMTLGALKFFAARALVLHAAVVMNDHVHVLCQPRPPATIDKLIHSWKGYSGHAISKRSAHRRGGVWQDESFDRIIRSERELRRQARCIAENPRNRWPEMSGDYPWLYLAEA